MKIIDEKGRLFGWINLLDLAVLIGVVIVLFVGVSAWLAIRQPPLEITGYSPAELSSGSKQTLTIKLNNERYLLSARLFLVPASGKGSTITYSAAVSARVRDQVSFSIPEDIPAGTYIAHLETTTMNVFQRKAVVAKIFANKFVVKEVPETEKKGPVFDNLCRWKITFSTLLISGIGERPSFAKGKKLLDFAGTQYRVISVADTIAGDLLQKLPRDMREKASMLVGLEVSTVFDSLGILLNSGGSLLTLKDGDQNIDLVPNSNIKVELDMLFYLNKQEHIGLLAPTTELSQQGGNGKALVIHSFGNVDNPWVASSAVPPENGLPAAFDVCRVSLECSLKDDGLYLGNTRLEPNRLIGFQADGTAITGGILSNSQPRLSAVVRVMVEAFPVQLENLLSPGTQITDTKFRQNIGKVIRIADTDRPDTPGLLLSSSQRSFGRDFKRMILDFELDCTISGGVPMCYGQPLDFGRTLTVGLLGRQITGTIRHDAKLPPRSVSSRESVQVEFRNVPPEFVAWIRVGEQEYSLNGPPTWKIVRIISSQPSKMYYPNSEGTRISVVDHPSYKTIRCLVELEVSKMGNDIYYAGNLLRIGSSLKFDAKKWSLGASLVAF